MLEYVPASHRPHAAVAPAQYPLQSHADSLGILFNTYKQQARLLGVDKVWHLNLWQMFRQHRVHNPIYFGHLQRKGKGILFYRRTKHRNTRKRFLTACILTQTSPVSSCPTTGAVVDCRQACHYLLAVNIQLCFLTPHVKQNKI